jgi:DNA repair exonuclease SbcCD nuclease subunit
MKPICAIITDIHISTTGKRDNSETIIKIAEQIRDYCLQNNINNLFIIGDVFKTRDSQNLKALVVFLKFLQILKRLNIYAIAGNHDKTDLSSNQSYLDVYNGQENLRVFQEVGQVDLEGISFHLIPYFPEDKEYQILLEKTVETLDDSVDNVLLSHIAVSGVKNNDGTKVQNQLKLSQFSKFDLVFLGHYHNKSKVGRNIHYIGSTIPHNFGEDNDKGLIILNSDLSFKTHPLKFPKFYSHEFDLEDEESRRELDLAYERYKDSKHNIRFILKGTKESLSKVNKSKYKDSGISIKTVNTEISKNIESVQNGNVIVYNDSKILISFIKYCKENNITDISYGKELLKRGLNNV